MRPFWWGFAVLVLIGAALVLPIGEALTPMTTDSTEVAPPPPSAFPVDTQLAGRELADVRINELSGLSASRLHPGVLYGVNDSGGGPYVYAIGATGETVATLVLDDVRARDWEALAPGWDADGAPVLWIGDIGDNSDQRDNVTLYKIREPADLIDQDVEWEEYSVEYADGPHDAEALLVRPDDGTIQIATKGKQREPGGLYQLQGSPSTQRTNIMERIGDVPTSITDGGWELSSAGSPRLVLIDYLRLHRRLEDTTWAVAIGPVQLQREALAWPWLPDRTPNDMVLLGSEGGGSEIVPAKVP